MAHLGTKREQEIVIDAARELGLSAGKSAGSWVVDGTTSESGARRLLEGWDACDPIILDLEPSPLSGEWADSPTEDDVLSEIAARAGADAVPEADRDDVIAAFLDAYSEGFWREATGAARALIGEDAA